MLIDVPENEKLLEETIVEKIGQNDEIALKYLFNNYHDRLCYYCYRMIRDKDAAKEIVHDVFVNIWINRKKWKPKNSVKSYLYKAVKNKSINYLKQPGFSLRSDNQIEEIEIHSQNNPGVILEAKEIREAYKSAVEKLPEKCRQIVILIKENGLSYQEAAEIQNVSIKTVETQMRLSFQKLRKMLKHFL